MRKSDVLISALFSFVILLAAHLAGSLISALVALLLSRLGQIPLFAGAIVRTAVCYVIVFAVVYAMGRFSGYRSGKSQGSGAWISSGIASIARLAVAVLMLFTPLWGVAPYLAALLRYGAELERVTQINEMPLWQPALVLVAEGAVCFFLLVRGEITGVRNRRADRLEMTGSEDGVESLLRREDEEKERLMQEETQRQASGPDGKDAQGDEEGPGSGESGSDGP